jgi:phosphoribosylglycinamide formyltransferase 1
MFRLAVLVSGEGSNLQAILDQLHGRDGIEVVGVASNNPEARGLERARRAGIEVSVFPGGGAEERAARDRALADWIEGRGAELIVLAGFMEILGSEFIRRFRGRIVNVHPSLLPAFPGVRPIRQALEYGVKVTGVTVHFVDEAVDSGPVILQEAFELTYPSPVRDVEERIHAIEHRLLPEAIRLIATGRVEVDAENPRVVRVGDPRSIPSPAGHGEGG